MNFTQKYFRCSKNYKLHQIYTTKQLIIEQNPDEIRWNEFYLCYTVPLRDMGAEDMI